MLRTPILPLALALAAAGCGQATAPDPGPPDAGGPSVSVSAGQDFPLRVGQTAELRGEGLAVRFLAVRGDSRCPEDVTCVWAGNAAVLLELRGPDAPRAELVLNTGVEPRQGVYRGHAVRLVSLSPAPRQGVPIEQRDYAATLRVTRQ